MYGMLRFNSNYRIVANLAQFKSGNTVSAKCSVLQRLSVRNSSFHQSSSSKLLQNKNNYYGRYMIITRSLGKGFNSPKTLKKLQISDGVHPRYEMIYRTDLGNYFVVGQITILAVAIVAVVILGIAYLERMELVVIDHDKPMEEPKSSKTEEFFKELRESMGIPETPEHVLKPKMEELKDGDIEALYVILIMTTTFFITLVRMLRRLPIRVYINSAGHCIGVYHNSVLPGKIGLREFVAGTLQSQENPKGFLWSHCVFKDGTGTYLYLMEEYFRYPQDFYRLLEKIPEDSRNGASQTE